MHFPGVNPGVTIGLTKSLKGGATTMTFYIGADLDSRSALLAAVDATGEVIKEKRVRTQRDEVLRFIEPYRPDVSVAVEATLTYYWFVDVLKEEGIDVHLAHPLMVKAISYAKIKTDSADAKTLAQLLRMGLLPEAYIYPKEKRAVRDLSRRRLRLSNQRALYYREIQQHYHQIGQAGPSRSTIRRLGPEVQTPFECETTREYLQGIEKLTHAYDDLIQPIAKKLHREGLTDSRYPMLLAIPGIGETYGPIILLESGDVSRFLDHRHYVSYARLVPGIYQSGQTSRPGRNGNQGNKYLKNAFRQAAIFAVRYDPVIRRFYDRKLARVHRKSIAFAIVARKLATAVFYILRDRRPFVRKKLFGE